MASIRVKAPDTPAVKTENPEILHAIVFSIEDGWFCYKDYEISKDVVEKHGKLVDKSNPDIFAIFLGQVTRKLRNLFGI